MNNTALSQEGEAIALLARRFFPEHGALRELHRGEGLVYEVAHGDQWAILKTVLAQEDDIPRMQAMLDWILYLRANGLSVPNLFPSSDGNLLEQVDCGAGLYAAYAYEMLPLAEENQIDWRNTTLPHKLGRTIGLMHRLANSYRPAPDRPTLGEWDQADWIQEPARVLHPSQAPIAQAILRLRDTLARFPHSAANYGLIHDDLHTGNVFFVNGELAIIDFDCAHYSWFAADIASALLFRVWIAPEKEEPTVRAQAAHFLKQLSAGYATQAPLPPAWAEMLAPLLKLREISLFQSFYRDVDASEGGGDALFRYLFKSISEDKPFLDRDVLALA